MFRSKTLILSLLAIVIGVTLIFRTFQSNSPDVISQLKEIETPNIALNPQPASSQPESSPAFSSLEQANLSLQASLSGLLTRIEQLEQGRGGLAATPTPSPTIVFQPQTIYLGSDHTQKHQWTETGVEVKINSGDYPADVSAVFEAGLSIVGGEVWARLKNKTTGAIINLTEIFHNNSQVTWKSSPAFKLHAGYNTYVVELKSTSGEIGYLSGARLRISR